MTTPADRFKHQFLMRLRDVITPEILTAWNELLDSSADPSAELRQLGDWAGEQLKEAIEDAVTMGEAEQEDVMSFGMDE